MWNFLAEDLKDPKDLKDLKDPKDLTKQDKSESVGISPKSSSDADFSHSQAANSQPLTFRAVDGVRTRDPQLGKLMLYQLSYYRVALVSQS